jgi:hypothetical protein
VAILPLLVVSVFLDGRPLLAYGPALLIGGHTYAPVAPYLTSVAQSLFYEDGSLVLVRDARQVRIRMHSIDPDALDFTYVPIVPLLRELGATVQYDARERAIEIRTPHAVVVVTPQPYSPPTVQLAPRTVFTPTPQPQRPPPWRGPPQPRRTPLPYPVPT